MSVFVLKHCNSGLDITKLEPLTQGQVECQCYLPGVNVTYPVGKLNLESLTLNTFDLPYVLFLVCAFPSSPACNANVRHADEG